MLSRLSRSFTAQTELNAWSFRWWFIIYSGGKLLSKIYSVRTEPSVTVQYMFDCEEDFFFTLSQESLFFIIRKIYLYVSFHPFVKLRGPICIWQSSLVANILMWTLALRNCQYVFITKTVGQRYQGLSIESIGYLPYQHRAFFFFFPVAPLHYSGLIHTFISSQRDSDS